MEVGLIEKFDQVFGGGERGGGWGRGGGGLQNF